MYVSSEAGMLALLELKTSMTDITAISGWPTRSVYKFALRHGFFFGPQGTPYRPEGSVDRLLLHGS